MTSTPLQPGTPVEGPRKMYGLWIFRTLVVAIAVGGCLVLGLVWRDAITALREPAPLIIYYPEVGL